MKNLIKLFKKKEVIGFILVIFIALIASRQLFKTGYFNMHDDLQMMRQLEMDKCVRDGQIPCRWISDMGYGYGFPLFNFYPPLPYIVGEVFRLIGFSFVNTIKAIFIVAFVASAISMYLLAKEFFGKLGGFLSSVFYIWAPYHAVDIYVRGAMNEAWALIWFPLILLFSYRLLIYHKSKIPNYQTLILLSLSWVGLLLSHNLMALIFGPVFAVWCLLWLVKSKNVAFKIGHLAISGLIALGLAAFFTIPAVIEQKYVQVNSLVTGYYEYIAHFANIKQLLFSRFWGYGPSVWGDNDGMSFQIGQIHWLLSIVILAFILFTLFKLKKNFLIHNSYPIILFFIIVGWFSAFMIHNKSTEIWKLVGPLKFVQFPWRFLTLTIFSFSFIAGSLTLFLSKKMSLLLVVALTLALILFNWHYFKPQSIGPLTDQQKFSGVAWDLQQTAGIYDYLPITAKQAPRSPASVVAQYLNMNGTISNVQQKTNKLSFDIEGKGGIIRVNTFEFPDWTVYIDGVKVPTYINSDEWGRIHFTVRPGSHQVKVILVNTTIRSISNAISLLTLVILIIFLYTKRRK